MVVDDFFDPLLLIGAAEEIETSYAAGVAGWGTGQGSKIFRGGNSLDENSENFLENLLERQLGPKKVFGGALGAWAPGPGLGLGPGQGLGLGPGPGRDRALRF